MTETAVGLIPRKFAASRLPNEPPLRRAPDFGVDPTLLRVRTIDLAVARSDKELRGMTGNMLWILGATSLAANAQINFDHDQGEKFTVSQGFFISGIVFNKFILTNTAQAGETITVVWGRVPNLSFNVVNPSLGASQTTLVLPANITTTADVSLVSVTATTILAADATRHHAIITNLASNTDTPRIGDTSVSATRGTPLAPGQSFKLKGTAEIQGFKPGAGNESVAITAVRA